MHLPNAAAVMLMFACALMLGITCGRSLMQCRCKTKEHPWLIKSAYHTIQYCTDTDHVAKVFDLSHRLQETRVKNFKMVQSSGAAGMWCRPM